MTVTDAPADGTRTATPLSLDPAVWRYITPTGDRTGTLRVTPALADFILSELSGENRRLIKGQFTRYTEMLRAGEWVPDAGGDILFDVNGRLRGGQHRLAAITESGVTMSFKVRWDQSEEEIAADNEGGTPWTAAAIAGGGTYSAQRQSIVIHLLITDIAGGGVTGASSRLPRTTSKLTVARLMTGNPAIERAAAKAARISSGNLFVPSAIGFLYAMYEHVHLVTGQGSPYEFFEYLSSGAGLDEGSPILALRNTLNGSVMRSRTDRRWQTAYVGVKAINDHIAGRRQNTRYELYNQSGAVRNNKPVKVTGWVPFFG